MSIYLEDKTGQFTTRCKGDIRRFETANITLARLHLESQAAPLYIPANSYGKSEFHGNKTLSFTVARNK